MLIYLSLRVTVCGEWAGGREGVGGASGRGRWGCDEGQQQVVRTARDLCRRGVAGSAGELCVGRE